MDVLQPKYRRILLKMSGEALSSKDDASAICPTILKRMATEVAEVYQLGVQIGIVVGGGNFFRGVQLSAVGINRITGDQMGMLATLMNALALRDVFEQMGLPCRIMSAIPVGSLVEPFNHRQAIRYLQEGQIVIFAGGTGNPLVTTDSAASLRGIEINADVVLKATQVDGIYSEDPRKNPQATLYKKLTYDECLQKELGIMDIAAFSQCRDHRMSIIVFNFLKSGALLNVVSGKNEGTLVEVAHD